LVSRNIEKLRSCANELKTLYGIQTTLHEHDFKNSSKPGFFDTLVAEVQDKDVSILINNVGLGDIYEYDRIPEQIIKDEIIVNALPQTVLTSRLLPQLLKRAKYSAIIDLSSTASIHPLPFYSIYCATKNFNKFFTVALSEEYKSRKKVDIMSVAPFFVTTPMTFGKKGILFITPEQCVEGCLKKLGYENCTNGHWWHSLQGWILGVLPHCLVSAVISRIAKGPLLKLVYAKKEYFKEAKTK